MRSHIASSSGSSDDAITMPRTLGGQLADQRVDLRLGADVDAAGRLVEEQHARLRQQALGERDLLLVAARQRVDERSGARSS